MMSSQKQSEIFKYNLITWKIFGIWPGRSQKKYYKYFSFIFLVVTLFIYNILLTLNLVYTPWKIEFIIREMIFYFTEITVMSKVLMVVIMRDKIIETFNLLDSEEMDGEDEKSHQKIAKNHDRFQTLIKFYAIVSNLGYSSQVFIPILLLLLFKSSVELLICKYYFLTDEIRDKYFIFWFLYQSFGMYGHMMYNVTIDSFVAGLLMLAIVQCQVLNGKLLDLKPSGDEKLLKTETLDQIQMAKLRKCLRRYDFLLNYCKLVQEIVNVMIFVQFGMSGLIICVVMCGLLLPSSTETLVFMVMYFAVMTMQIFLPGYLGTQLNYESQELVFAAYNTEWIPRSESFKRSIRIFVERANIPIQMSGLKMFPLSLFTFTSIMKSNYSFFTLIRNMQDK